MTGVAYSADSTKLATISRDGRLVIRPATLDQLIALARQQVTRSLTDLDCLQYLRVPECPSERSA